MPYGKYLYGVLAFGSETEDGESPDYPIPDLMQYLPSCYEDSLVMRRLQGTNAEELGALRYAVDDVLRQFYVETATWGLAIWEYELGLATDPSKPYERRRETVKAKLRGSGATTRQMIIDTAAAFSGGEVAVTEYPAEYRFEVQFIGVKGIPPNMAGFLAMLDAIKPAHLAYSIKYTYTTWEMLGTLTWGQMATKTWGEIKVYEGA